MVSGCMCFVGSRLADRLSELGYQVRSLARRPMQDHDNIVYVRADALDLAELTASMQGIETAYYLLYSREGSANQWQDFAERERKQAANFLAAAETAGVKRIIYLGELVGQGVKLSPHTKSRKGVGRILAGGNIPVTELRASLVIGVGEGSFMMLRYLVERLRVMICPSWVQSRTQPIAVSDVVEYLVGCLERDQTAGKVFEIGGPDTMTYEQIMREYSKHLGRSLFILRIPFLTIRLSSLWVYMITPVRASLAKPLVDSLVHDTVVDDPAITRIIPLELKNVAESIKIVVREQEQNRDGAHLAGPVCATRTPRTGLIPNQRILIFSLLAMGVCGTVYYWLDDRSEVYEPLWLLCSAAWYVAIVFVVIMVHNKTRLGYMLGGILSWTTLAFWLLDNFYVVFETSLISAAPGPAMVIRNFAGVTVAAIAVATSHNLFHNASDYQRSHEMHAA